MSVLRGLVKVLAGSSAFLKKMATEVYLSKEGLEKLKEELNFLKTTKRKEIIERIETAKEMGDLSENAEYTDAKEEQGFVEGRVLELEDMINNATVVEENTNKSMVNIGSMIKVRSEAGEKDFHVVGSNEADPVKGKISYESPLGKAFIGKRIGDEVEVIIPKGIIKYTIVEIK